MKKDQLTNKPKEIDCLRIGAVILGAALLVCLVLPGSAMAADLSPIEQLGKYLFFDNMSNPMRMSCSTCHAPKAGWTYPVSDVNLHQAVATGADPHTSGGRKPPSNAYATFSPKFTLVNGAGGPNTPNGGNFWDGRSIGFGGNVTGVHTEVIGPEVIDSAPFLNSATKTLYKTYLIPTADQALNPFPNPVEQNIIEQEVVLHVASAKYAPLWQRVWGEPIVCSNSTYPGTGFTVCQVNYRRIAVALAAYQASAEVNSFSSRLDAALKYEKEVVGENPPLFPLALFTAQENRGHNLFYANCALFCHNSGSVGQNRTDIGELYTGQGYFNIGTPANLEISGFDPASPDLGLFKHTGIEAHKGLTKVPTMRNVDKRPDDEPFVRAYGHNGFFKSLEEIVHFYNTRDVPGEGWHGQPWPAPEVAANVFRGGPFGKPGFGGIGNLGLTPEEEADIVAYLKTLTDTLKVQDPKPYK